MSGKETRGSWRKETARIGIACGEEFEGVAESEVSGDGGATIMAEDTDLVI